MRKMITLANATFLLAVTGAAFAQSADVQVIHNSPDPAAVTVDVYLNGALAIDDFAFRTATPVLQLDAGVPLTIGIAPGNSGGPSDIIAEFPVTLTAGERYLVMATGVLDPSLPGNPDGLDTGFTLKIFTPLTTDAPADQVALLAYHGAPNAPSVDVLADGVGVLIPNLAYGDFAGYLTVQAADYILRVTPAGENGTVVASFVAPLSGFGGAGAVVFASGFLGDKTLPGFGLFAALPSGEVLELPVPDVAIEPTNWSTVKALFE